MCWPARTGDRSNTPVPSNRMMPAAAGRKRNRPVASGIRPTSDWCAVPTTPSISPPASGVVEKSRTPASYHARLARQQKQADGPWESPQWLVVPPFSEYNVFYHRLTIDRQGRLFLSYDCWSTYWFYRTDHPGSRRALMMSADGGKTWKLAKTSDLVP